MSSLRAFCLQTSVSAFMSHHSAAAFVLTLLPLLGILCESSDMRSRALFARGAFPWQLHSGTPTVC
jgi:hypothetical protein